MIRGKKKNLDSYLILFCPRAVFDIGTGFREMGGCGVAPSLAGTGGGFSTHCDLGGLGGCWPGSADDDLERSSPIFAFRRVVGMRLIRISTRDRSCCAWMLYCALNLRARSVTID